MKINLNYLRAGILSIAAGGIMFVSGCVVQPDGRVTMAPIVVQPAVVVAPGVEVAPEPILVPDSYVWDGVEFVGLVGNQYYYLGAGNVWLEADSVRLGRFHDWERFHPDWRAHAVRNELYRRDRNGRIQERREDQKAMEKKRKIEHDEHDH